MLPMQRSLSHSSSSVIFATAKVPLLVVSHYVDQNAVSLFGFAAKVIASQLLYGLFVIDARNVPCTVGRV